MGGGSNGKNQSLTLLLIDTFLKQGSIILSRLPERKHPRDIEPRPDSAAEEITPGFAEPGFVGHARAVGEMQLENVAAGFDVKADGERCIHTAGQAV